MKNLITIGKFVLLFLLTNLFCVSCDIEEDENEPFYVSVKISNGKSETVYFYVDQDYQMGIGPNLEYSVVMTLSRPAVFSVKNSDGVILNSKTISNAGVYIVSLTDGSTEGTTDVSQWSLPIEVKNTGALTEYVYVDGVKKYIVGPFETLKETASVSKKSVEVEIKTEDGKTLCSESCSKGDYFKKRRIELNVANFYSGKILLLLCDGKMISIIPNTVSENSYTYGDNDFCMIEVTDEGGNLLDLKIMKESESTYKFTYIDPEMSYIFIENTTNDNYDITVDGVMIGSVAPGAKKLSVNSPGKHQLNAKQKDGYILWATEENKTVDCVAGIYSWNFDDNVFKEIK
ncbi:MAG: hypothetical protein IKP81_02695 [Paludibacteraceae bacterium]|nr:hypothetical protein [Paludibacteraceae bacterium]